MARLTPRQRMQQAWMAEQQERRALERVRQSLPELPAQRHSDTSVAAADSMRLPASGLRLAVFSALLEAGDDGLTDEEIQNLLAMNPSTERPRRIELCEAGLVRDSGLRRLTSSNRSAVVWIATRRQDAIRSPLLCGE